MFDGIKSIALEKKERESRRIQYKVTQKSSSCEHERRKTNSNLSTKKPYTQFYKNIL
jgi:hypothetical protein